MTAIVSDEKRVREAFREPYRTPLDREEIVALLDEYGTPLPSKVRAIFWDRVYRVVVEQRFNRIVDGRREQVRPPRLPWIRPLVGQLPHGDLNGIADEEFARDREVLLRDIYVARYVWVVHFEGEGPAGTWTTRLKGLLDTTWKPFLLSGTPRTRNGRTRWVFDPPAVDAAAVAKGNYNDLESFVSLFLYRVGRRTFKTGARQLQKQAGLIPVGGEDEVNRAAFADLLKERGGAAGPEDEGLSGSLGLQSPGPENLAALLEGLGTLSPDDKEVRP
jgi:hypothetical protein